ncbi:MULTISPECIES: hypothetical protein [unclassified Nocardioides]|uniref:hypothetical protein n=1 Tax=unclassified Nocardioides TaxID=2615069 RepID=UPI0006FF2387|nr:MULTISPECIES: hypothetical protein [unclassified Nocardioides]KRA38870.1 hypothetical protein ASD81_09850 [Nocardioides sp. Root614]KRA92830.1 hypothetical protein ASD84_10115 [Nocardioides sp. Root682]
MTDDVERTAEPAVDPDVVDVDGDAVDPDVVDDTGAADTDAAPRSDRRWPILCAVLALLLIAAAVGCFVLAQDRSDLEDRASAESAATEEAERIVVSWLTYDYRTYEDDMTWVTSSGTEKFQKEYSPEALEGLREKMIGPQELVSRGRVVNSAATTKDAEHVRVLVFTDQTLTDKDIRSGGAEPLHARSGVELSMVRVDGKWLVDEMVQLQFQ